MIELKLADLFNYISSFKEEVAATVGNVVAENLLAASGLALLALWGTANDWKFVSTRNYLSEKAYVRRFELTKTNEVNPETGNHFVEFESFAGDEIDLGDVFPRASSKAIVKSLMKAVAKCTADRSAVFSKLDQVFIGNKIPFLNSQKKLESMIKAVDRDWTDFFQAWSFKNREFLGPKFKKEIFPILVKESEKLPHPAARSTLHVFIMQPELMRIETYPEIHDMRFPRAEDKIYFELARQVAVSCSKPENKFVPVICRVPLP